MAERPPSGPVPGPLLKIDRARVEHVARLASLVLEPAEVDLVASQLARIVAYVDQLDELDTTDVLPTVNLSDGAALRPDEPRPGLTHAEALDQAPRASGGGFAVPRFLDAPRTGR